MKTKPMNQIHQSSEWFQVSRHGALQVHPELRGRRRDAETPATTSSITGLTSTIFKGNRSKNLGRL